MIFEGFVLEMIDLPDGSECALLCASVVNDQFRIAAHVVDCELFVAQLPVAIVGEGRQLQKCYCRIRRERPQRETAEVNSAERTGPSHIFA